MAGCSTAELMMGRVVFRAASTNATLLPIAKMMMSVLAIFIYASFYAEDGTRALRA
jgi:hypothetical protein